MAEEVQSGELVPKGFEATTHPIFTSSGRKRKRDVRDGGGGSGSGGVNGGSVGQSKRVPTEGSASKVCPICLDVVLLPVFPSSCLHIFCAHCLVAWLRLSDGCPLCKLKIKTLYYDVRSSSEYRLLDFRGKGARAHRRGSEEGSSSSSSDGEPRHTRPPPIHLEDYDDFQFWLTNEDPYTNGRLGRGQSLGRRSMEEIAVEGRGKALFLVPPRVISDELTDTWAALDDERAVCEEETVDEEEVAVTKQGARKRSLASSSSAELRLELRLVRTQTAMLRAALAYSH